MNHQNFHQVLECASPLALLERCGADRKCRKTGALQDATARSRGSGVYDVSFGRGTLARSRSAFDEEKAAPKPDDGKFPSRVGRIGHWYALMVLLAFYLPLAHADAGLTIGWTNNMLTISGPDMPGGKVEIWYLEAFCRSGSTHRDWQRTTIPHKTELVSAKKDGKRLQLRTTVEPNVEVMHEVRAGSDEVDFKLTLKNHGHEFVDVQWFQPCLRVDRFTGCNQTNYITKSFVFTDRGLTMLDKTRRTEEAIYHGGQVYAPKGINLEDVNPRPLSPDQPVSDLIGCFSADAQHLLAMAWDQTQELFQGVIVCLHNDPRVGGLKAGETKKLHGKIYFMKNDPEALLRRYKRDFPK